MKLIFLGAPGAGKGTQAAILAKALRIPTVSTGNILRAAVASGSELGRQVQTCMESGTLVSDDIILRVTLERLAAPDCADGYLLDGVPRTIPQAEALEAHGVRFDRVISIEISDEEILSRMSGRRVCPQCGASYHVAAVPPKRAGVCDECGAALVTRADDAPETVRARLAVYHRETEPLKAFYRARGVLCPVEAQGSVEATAAAVREALGVRL